MAKNKIDRWLTPEGLTTISTWARRGLTDKQIASNMDIHYSTIYEYKKNYPEFAKAIDHSKDEADCEVENALYNKALSGDTTAMIFWLKNRQGKHWKDKQQIDSNVKANVSIEEFLKDNQFEN